MKKSYCPAFKAQIVRELLKEEKSVNQLAAAHGLDPNQLDRWCDIALNGLPNLFVREGAEGQAAKDADLSLTPQPGLDDLDELIGQVRSAGVPVELRIEGDPEPLSPGVDLAAYRIVQEALTNTLKHAGPAQAQVTLRYRHNEVELEVNDDGAGTGTGGGAGQGLIGMRERVAIYGGVFESGRRHGGYVVRARLPLEGGRQ